MERYITKPMIMKQTVNFMNEMAANKYIDAIDDDTQLRSTCEYLYSRIFNSDPLNIIQDDPWSRIENDGLWFVSTFLNNTMTVAGQYDQYSSSRFVKTVSGVIGSLTKLIDMMTINKDGILCIDYDALDTVHCQVFIHAYILIGDYCRRWLKWNDEQTVAFLSAPVVADKYRSKLDIIINVSACK